MVGQLSSMAVLPEKDCGAAGADLLLSMCIKVLARTVAAVPAFCLTILPSLADSDRQVRFEHAATGSCAVGCPTLEPCLASESIMTNSTAAEEHVPTTCKVHDETLAGPDTSVRLKSKEINAWLAVLKNKDDDDDDEDDEDEEDEEDDEDDVADEDDVGEEGEGEGEEAEGLRDGNGGDDDDDDEDDDDENGKDDEDEEEDEDAVEAEDEEDDEGVEDEEEDDEEDEDDEAPEPPQKKRK